MFVLAVKFLFVKVCEPVSVVTVASIATDKMSVATPVVVIPVPPWIVNVSEPVVIVWSEPPSPATVKVETADAVPGLNLPEAALNTSAWPFVGVCVLRSNDNVEPSPNPL